MKSVIRLALENRHESEGPMLSMEEETVLQQETEDTQVEVVKDLDEAEKTLEVVGALEDLAIVAQSIKEVSPQEAALIQIAADGIMRDTGVDGSVITPAMEDMTGSSGESIAERIKETIKRILAAIKELLIELGKKLAKFIDGSNRLGEQKLKRVNELLKRAEKIEVAGVKNSTIKVKGLFLSRGSVGEVRVLTRGSDIVKAVRIHNNTVEIYKHGSERFLNAMIDGVSSFFNGVRTALTNVDADETVLEVLRAKALKVVSLDLSWMSRIADEDSVSQDPSSGRKFNTSGRETLLGMEFNGHTWGADRIKQAKTHAEIASAVEQYFRHMSLSAGYANRDVHEVTMEPLSVSDVEQLLNEAKRTVLECVNSGESLNAVFQDQLKKLENVSKELQAFVKSENIKGDGRVWMTYVNIVQSVISSITRRVNWSYSMLLRSNQLITDRAISIADASLSTYSKS